MIGDRAMESIIDNTKAKKWQKRASININSIPLEKGDNPLTNLDVLTTSGAYALTYKPIPDNPQFANMPYVLRCDLFACNKIRFANYKDLLKMAESDKKVKWLVENTNLTPKHLEIAKNHPITPIPIVFDVASYMNKLGTKNNTSRFLWEVE